ncbi:hypothetical protein CIG19_12940 [Enterobacterales bacterium CwR94]|nr:hypothetical protein CIG19_12940 [Enterobacterales bacterium CwR94]
MLSVAALWRYVALLTTSAPELNLTVSLPPAAKTQPVSPPSSTLFQEKEAWGPFHVGAITPDDPRIHAAPPSALRLQVTGILSSSAATGGMAILSDGKQQVLLTPGETLPERAGEVVRIFGDRIIIVRQGKYESIIMEPRG